MPDFLPALPFSETQVSSHGRQPTNVSSFCYRLIYSWSLCPWGVRLDFLLTNGWALFVDCVAQSKLLMAFYGLVIAILIKNNKEMRGEWLGIDLCTRGESDKNRTDRLCSVNVWVEKERLTHCELVQNYVCLGLPLFIKVLSSGSFESFPPRSETSENLINSSLWRKGGTNGSLQSERMWCIFQADIATEPRGSQVFWGVVKMFS